MCACSHVRLSATPWAVAHQAPLSMGFFKQEYWSGLLSPSPGDLPGSGLKPRFSCTGRWILHHWATRVTHKKINGEFQGSKDLSGGAAVSDKVYAKVMPGRLASSRPVSGLRTYSSPGPWRGCTPASSLCVSISLSLSHSVPICLCVYVCM